MNTRPREINLFIEARSRKAAYDRAQEIACNPQFSSLDDVVLCPMKNIGRGISKETVR